jgi:biopolymer transport protein TolQ
MPAAGRYLDVLLAAAVAPGLVLLGVDSIFFRLLLEAGLFAKFILLLLLILSIVAWGVAYDKWSLYRRVERQIAGIRTDVAAMKSVDELTDLASSGYAGPLLGMVREAHQAVQRMRRHNLSTNAAIGEFQRASEKAALDSIGILEKNLVVLSTTTTVSPFLGLLGTCWGIMISFINIGQAGSASLDVVAPGIAEALIATIAGLGTAIPSLVFYNMLSNRLHKIEGEMQAFAISIVELMQREANNERARV